MSLLPAVNFILLISLPSPQWTSPNVDCLFRLLSCEDPAAASSALRFDIVGLVVQQQVSSSLLHHSQSIAQFSKSADRELNWPG